GGRQKAEGGRRKVEGRRPPSRVSQSLALPSPLTEKGRGVKNPLGAKVMPFRSGGLDTSPPLARGEGKARLCETGEGLLPSAFLPSVGVRQLSGVDRFRGLKPLAITGDPVGVDTRLYLLDEAKSLFEKIKEHAKILSETDEQLGSLRRHA
ncbi:MAG: hypothetical protein K2V38_27885, partial [Gemmataceae bacterium]|nr:hypothetical protein [Gemmataceae bacterium]